jgi:hypothetical protein
VPNLSTPVLFLIFNRPDTTKRVFDQIREAQPCRLYIAADGPRKGVSGEDALCRETRNICAHIDWSCDVQTLFRDQNLGCRTAVNSAISWFFEQEEQGIILEDDCLPSPGFFSFCESMLEKYRDDERVMHIGGSNFQDSREALYSYYFSNVHHVWGWATWRRAWTQYDATMPEYDEFLSSGFLRQMFPKRYHQQLWKDCFAHVRSGRWNTWDYQWTYSIWKSNGLGITPQANLISNIGFSASGTHTTSSEASSLAERTTFQLGNLSHPIIMRADQRADSYTLNTYLIRGFWNRFRLQLKSYLE